MTTCNRCGKAVGSGEWDIHTCTPKPRLCDDCETVSHCLKHGCIPKQPAQRTWVGLTDEEAMQICVDCGCLSEDWLTLLDAVEAKLRSKNT